MFISDNVYPLDGIKLTIGLPFYVAQSYAIAYRKRLRPMISAVDNWWCVLLVHAGVLKSAAVRLKDGGSFNLTKKNIAELMIYAEFNTLPKEVRKNIHMHAGYAVLDVCGRKLRLGKGAIEQVASEFHYNKHNLIDVKSRDVVDVGAYVGDSTLYYILAGKAKHVYGFEPYKRYFNLARKAVLENDLDKKITMFNCAVAGKDSYGFLNEASDDFMVSAKASAGSKRIRALSLDTISGKLKLRGAALKVDCEGCERDIFLHVSSETLEKFDSIHVEYHYGYKDLVDRLRKEGFIVSYTKPRYNFKGLNAPGMVFGDIIAIKHAMPVK